MPVGKEKQAVKKQLGFLQERAAAFLCFSIQRRDAKDCMLERVVLATIAPFNLGRVIAALCRPSPACHPVTDAAAGAENFTMSFQIQQAPIPNYP